jgi:hypothetical protein
MPRLPLVLRALLATVILGAGSLQAAIRVTVEDGNPLDTRIFMLSDSGGSSGSFNIGGVEVFTTTAATNIPTGSAVASLITGISIIDDTTPGGGFLPTFTVTTEFVDVNGNLLRFTAPSGSTLSVRSDVSSAENRNVTGTIQNRTIVNGTNVDSLAIPIFPTTEADVTNPTVPNPTGEYTLQSILTITGINVGAHVGITGTSEITGIPSPAPGDLVPEPSSLAVFGLGSLALAFIAQRRRKLRAPSDGQDADVKSAPSVLE